MRICEPNHTILNQDVRIGDPNYSNIISITDTMNVNANKKHDLIFGDCHVANKYYPDSYKKDMNTLRPVVFTVDTGGTGARKEFIQRNIAIVYPDLDQHESIKMLANGEDYQWQFDGFSKDFFQLTKNAHMTNRADGSSIFGTQQTIVAMQSCFEFPSTYKRQETQYRYKGQTDGITSIDYKPANIANDRNRLKPILINIPDFPHDSAIAGGGGSDITHKAYFYVTYHGEMEFHIPSYKGKTYNTIQRNYLQDQTVYSATTEPTNPFQYPERTALIDAPWEGEQHRQQMVGTNYVFDPSEFVNEQPGQRPVVTWANKNT